jgi:hypothetical protein
MIALRDFPRDSHTTVPRDRSTTAGLRRALLLLAIVLTVMAGPLGRSTSDQAPSDENFQPVTVTSFTVAGPAR